MLFLSKFKKQQALACTVSALSHPSLPLVQKTKMAEESLLHSATEFKYVSDPLLINRTTVQNTCTYVAGVQETCADIELPLKRHQSISAIPEMCLLAYP